MPSKRPLDDTVTATTATTTPNSKMPRIEGAAACPTPSPQPSDATSPARTTFEQLPLTILSHISSYVPLPSRLSHLTRLSRSYPPLAPACFRDDHLDVTFSFCDHLFQTPAVRHLLSEVTSVSLTAMQREVFQWTADFGTSSDARPPFLPGLEQLVVNVKANSYWREGEWDRDVEVRGVLEHWANTDFGYDTQSMSEQPAAALVSLRRLFTSVCSSCPHLTTLHVNLVGQWEQDRYDEQSLSTVLGPLTQLASLRDLRLGGFTLQPAQYVALLALPLTSLDLSSCFLLYNPALVPQPEPHSSSLRTLQLPDDLRLELHQADVHDVFRPFAPHLTHLRVSGMHAYTSLEQVTPQTVEPPFFPSAFGVTALSVNRGHVSDNAVWEWSLLIDPTTSSPRLPSLLHLELNVWNALEVDTDALLGLLNVYGPQLQTVSLVLRAAHPVLAIAAACWACPWLQSLKLDMQQSDQVEVVDEDVNAFPTSSSLRSLHLRGWVGMTEAQVVRWMAACPLLETLTLTFVPRLSLSVLPGLGRACRHLRQVHLIDGSPLMFGTTPTPLTDGEVLFSRLSELKLQQLAGPRAREWTTQPWPFVSEPCSSAVLEWLASLLTPTPLRSLTITGSAVHSAYDLRVFTPLLHLQELEVKAANKEDDVNVDFLAETTAGRRQVAEQLLPRISPPSDWGGLHPRWVFQEERRFVSADGRWMDGREAFFASLKPPLDVTEVKEESQVVEELGGQDTVPTNPTSTTPPVYGTARSNLSPRPADTSAASTATTSTLERLPLTILSHISSYVALQPRLSHLTRLSRSYLPPTRAAFREDHLVLTPTLLTDLSNSPALRDLLSEVASASLDARERDVMEWKAGSAVFRDARPPFQSGLVQFAVRLSAEDVRKTSRGGGLERDERDDDEEVRALVHRWSQLRAEAGPPISPAHHQIAGDEMAINARRRVTLERLMTSLITTCPLLATLDLTLDRRGYVNEAEGETHAVLAICQLPALRHLRLEGFLFHTAACQALLALPLISLDLDCSHFHLNSGVELSHSPPLSTLRSLHLFRCAGEGQVIDLVRPVAPHLTSLTLTQIGDPPTFSSFSSLSSLVLIRPDDSGVWDWSLLIDRSSTAPRRLPVLRELELRLFTWQEGDNDALHPWLLDEYGPALTSLKLRLHSRHPVLPVTRASLACPHLETFSLTMQASHDLYLSLADEDLTTLPTSSSIRSLTLDNLQQLTGAQVVQMAATCPLLHELSLGMMTQVSLSGLLAIGRACRELRRLTMVGVVYSLLQSAPVEVIDLSSSSSSSSFSSSASSSAPVSTPVFPHLQDFTIGGRGLGYSTAALEWLVSILSSSPLRALSLELVLPQTTFLPLKVTCYPDRLTFEQQMRVFTTLTRLERLTMSSSWSVPRHFLDRTGFGRTEMQRVLEERTGRHEWSMRREGFKRERVFQDADGQWMNGREAFFHSLAHPTPPR